MRMPLLALFALLCNIPRARAPTPVTKSKFMPEPQGHRGLEIVKTVSFFEPSDGAAEETLPLNSDPICDAIGLSYKRPLPTKEMGIQRCTVLFHNRYSELMPREPVLQNHAIVLLNMFQASHRRRVVIKAQDLGLYDKEYDIPLGAIESAEASVGFILNGLMDRINGETGLITSDSNQALVSRYVGFARTYDFFYCNADPIYFDDDFSNNREIREWIDERPETRRQRVPKITTLYLVLEFMTGRTLTEILLDHNWLCRDEDEKACENFLSSPEGEPIRIRVDFDPLRSMLIQVMSTLWYATEVEFAHMDLHSSNIVTTENPDGEKAELWNFDFMPLASEPFDRLSSNAKGFADPLPEDSRFTAHNIRARQKVRATGDQSKTIAPKAVLGVVAQNRAREITRKAKTLPTTRKRGRRSRSVVMDDSGFLSSILRMASHLIGANSEKEEDDDVIDDENDGPALIPAGEPLISFRVPSRASRGKLYKIIDFGRSRAVDPGPKREIFYAFIKPYMPLTDLKILGMEIIRGMPERLLRYPTLAKFSEPRDLEYRDFLEEEYEQLTTTLQYMLGWNVASERMKNELMHFCRTTLRDSDLFITHRWLPSMHSALKYKPNKLGEGQGPVVDFMYDQWFLVEPSATRKAVKLEFLRTVMGILNLPFFAPFVDK